MKTLYIIDLYGNRIQVTDLTNATNQAEAFKEYRHEDPDWAEYDNQLQKYWIDMHEKLLLLAENTDQEQMVRKGDDYGTDKEV